MKAYSLEQQTWLKPNYMNGPMQGWHFFYVCGFEIQDGHQHEFLTSALYEMKKGFFLETTKNTNGNHVSLWFLNFNSTK